MKPLSSPVADERGASAVEFALVVPLLLVLVAVILLFGQLFLYRALLHRGAEVGARAAALSDDYFAETDRYRTLAEIAQAARAATVFLDQADVCTFPPGTCTAGGEPFADFREGDALGVQLQMTYSSPAAGLLRALSGATGTGDEITISAYAAAVRE